MASEILEFLQSLQRVEKKMTRVLGILQVLETLEFPSVKKTFCGMTLCPFSANASAVNWSQKALFKKNLCCNESRNACKKTF